jgi:hypothetical protein
VLHSVTPAGSFITSFWLSSERHFCHFAAEAVAAGEAVAAPARDPAQYSRKVTSLDRAQRPMGRKLSVGHNAGYGLVLLAVLLFPPAYTSAQTAPASATLVPDHATLAIQAPKGDANGLLHVTLNGAQLDNVTLRASPLMVGDAYAFVRFPASGSDLIRLDDKKLQCQANKDCMVPYEVYGAWAAGVYQGAVDAYTPQGKIGATPISAVRPVAAFRPVITSDAMHDGRIVFDATSSNRFLLSVQNPAGSPPHKILLSGEPADPACLTPGGGPGAPISFAPPEFHLEPGAAQTVIATVAPCLTAGIRLAVLRTVNGDEPGAWTETVVSLSRHAPATTRQLSLLAFVILGSVVSVLLNNIFPVNRTKNGLRNDLRRADEVLRECANAGPALIDSFAAEARRLRLSLQGIHFYDATKLAVTQEAQQGVAALATAATLTRRISLMRSKVDGATMSIAAHTMIRGKIRDAEEALLAGDATAANDRLTEAQANLTEAIADAAQSILRKSLTTNLPKLMRERGVLVDHPKVQAARPDATAAPEGGPAPAAAAQLLDQPEGRHPRIKAFVEQLWQDNQDLETLTAQEMLDIERDFYVADVWTEYVEPRLKTFEDPRLAARRPALVKLAESLLDCLLHNPKSDYVQVLLDLLCSDITPDEIAAALTRGEARIDCDPRPKYLESVNIAFVFTNPLLNDVPAAKRLLNFFWSINDDTGPPPDMDHFRHYFRQPILAWSMPWRTSPSAKTFTIAVNVRVPFADDTAFTLPSQAVTPRRTTGAWWKFEPMEWASFSVTTAIAIVTAFGAHYASSLPDVITWSDWLSSFMFGFGLDQLRDTVVPATAAQPTALPATGPHE